MRPGRSLRWSRGRSGRDSFGRDGGRASLGRSTCGRISATHAGDRLAGIPRVALDVAVVWYSARRGLVGPQVFGVGALGAHVGLAGRRVGREGLDLHAVAMAIVGEVVLDGGLERPGRVGRHGGRSTQGDLKRQASG